MGMFDTLHFTCPTCGEHVEEQTKEGDCLLRDYTIDNMPKAMLIDMDGYKVECSQGHHFHVEVQSVVVAKLVIDRSS